MRELIQLVLSIFFGLVPLWLILARRRNRSNRNNREREAVAPTHDTPDTAPRPEQKTPQKRAWHTPLPWENETMLRLRTMYREREQKAVDIPQEPPPAVKESSPAKEHTPLVPSASDLTEELAISQSEQSDVYNRSEQNRTPFPLLPAAAIYNELQRAVLFAEILGAPRSLQEWEPPS